MNIRIELLKLQDNASLLDRAEFAAKFMAIADQYSRLQKSQQCNISRFDGCSTCKNNIIGLESGLWCINNCVAGSKYEDAQNIR